MERLEMISVLRSYLCGWNLVDLVSFFQLPLCLIFSAMHVYKLCNKIKENDTGSQSHIALQPPGYSPIWLGFASSWKDQENKGPPTPPAPCNKLRCLCKDAVSLGYHHYHQTKLCKSVRGHQSPGGDGERSNTQKT